MFGHPEILLRCAKPHPNNVGFCVVDSPNHVLVLFWRERPKRRRNPAAHVQSRESSLQVYNELLRDARHPTIEEMFVPFRLGEIAQTEYEIGPIDPVLRLVAGPFQQPDEWHAVGHSEPCPVECGSYSRKPLALHYPVGRDTADIFAIPCFDPSLHNFPDTRERKSSHSTPQT